MTATSGGVALRLLRYWGIVAPTWGEVGEAVCSMRLGLGFGEVGQGVGCGQSRSLGRGARPPDIVLQVGDERGAMTKGNWRGEEV